MTLHLIVQRIPWGMIDLIFFAHGIHGKTRKQKKLARSLWSAVIRQLPDAAPLFLVSQKRRRAEYRLPHALQNILCAPAPLRDKSYSFSWVIEGQTMLC